jgi:hypothetical protein
MAEDEQILDDVPRRIDVAKTNRLSQALPP